MIYFTAKNDNKNPNIKDPVSPMKILFFTDQLNLKKPIKDPAKPIDKVERANNFKS